jgi:hypothetical protein
MERARQLGPVGAESRRSCEAARRGRRFSWKYQGLAQTGSSGRLSAPIRNLSNNERQLVFDKSEDIV